MIVSIDRVRSTYRAELTRLGDAEKAISATAQSLGIPTESVRDALAVEVV